MFKKYYKRGYTINKWGYVYLWMPDHPHTKNGYIKRSRFVMEQKLRRYLTSEEVVHHINSVKDDDKPENLQLFKSNSEHQKGRLAWNKGKQLTQRHRQNLSKSHKGQISWCKGKKFSKEYRKKLSDAHKGQKPWNKNKKTGIITNGAWTKGHLPWNKGIPCSPKTKRKISETKKESHIKTSVSVNE